jgi:hypothetical protein
MTSLPIGLFVTEHSLHCSYARTGLSTDRGWYVVDSRDGVFYMNRAGSWTHGVKGLDYFWSSEEEASAAIEYHMDGKSEMRKRVYIACPISNGDKERSVETRTLNLKRATEAFDTLWKMGLAPMNPAFSACHPNWEDVPYRVWTEIDKPWVLASAAVYRVSGESLGADEECDLAFQNGIPVFSELSALAAYFGISTETVDGVYGIDGDLGPIGLNADCAS